MSTDRLFTVVQLADLLGVSAKTVRHYIVDSSKGRTILQPVTLLSPTGSRPIIRWRDAEELRFAGLEP